MDDSRGTRLDWKGEISPDSPTYPYPNYPVSDLICLTAFVDNLITYRVLDILARRP